MAGSDPTSVIEPSYAIDSNGSGGVDQKIKNLPIPSGRFFKVPAVECTPNEENLYTD